MTRKERLFIQEINDHPNFGIKNLIVKIGELNHQPIEFSKAILTSNKYEVFGRISRLGRVIKFTISTPIVNTPEARYAYALLLAIYLEVYPEYPNGGNLAYITSDGEIFSDDLDLEGRPIQSMLNRTARDILINDDLFEEDYKVEELSLRQLSEKYGVPRRIIIEKLDDMGF